MCESFSSSAIAIALLPVMVAVLTPISAWAQIATDADPTQRSIQVAGEQVQRCQQQLAGIWPDAKELIRIRKLISKNLHLRGSAHNLVPHWTSTYAEIQQVHRLLASTDIVYLVYLLNDETTSSGIRATTIGVLSMFGPASLPCIDAALATQKGRTATHLRSVRTNIEMQGRSKQIP